MDSSHGSWLSIFIVTCRKIWSRRNMLNHGEVVPPIGSKVDIILKFISDLDTAITNQKNYNLAPLVSNVTVSWTFPEEGFVKVNTDGASRGNPGMAACGGVIRSSQGLERAWGNGYRKIILESDSLLAITVLTKSGAAVCEVQLVSRIRTWLGRDWHVQLHHNFREGNSCADWLANFILDSFEQAKQSFFSHPPLGVQHLYLGDLASVGRECIVALPE
ncbi:uncharacterized protein LOC133284905 [Gastrolobium bilobum]|uniref:uncharacterized protein LOC133284905 n=1 Tax=Gastrolobium bilobum TaxID=150636 RepID=UPI002AAF2EDC|nr:uncharacterized protein LOC133284905 [Gastrolobium bilobum]